MVRFVTDLTHVRFVPEASEQEWLHKSMQNSVRTPRAGRIGVRECIDAEFRYRFDARSICSGSQRAGMAAKIDAEFFKDPARSKNRGP